MIELCHHAYNSNVYIIVIYMLISAVFCAPTQPNFIVIITDDQDVLLGSLNVMPKVQDHLIKRGMNLHNAFVTTPVCCPSRSSFLTGLYAHNHGVLTNRFNCSSLHWKQTHEPFTFGKILQDQGYRTAYIGKYLNKYDGKHVPQGWTKWFGLIRNSKFYNYSVNNDGVIEHFGSKYSRDYLTDVVTNMSLSVLYYWSLYHPNAPFLLVLSYPAPHGPEDSAPQYQHLFEGNTMHHTQSYNYAPNPDKMWLFRHTGKMSSLHQRFTNILQQKRLQTLQSVDDGVSRLFQKLSQWSLINRTYIFYTSDHGYHLGQFGLLKGKATPFEFDIRVPLLVRGPGIKPNSSSSLPVLNIDFLPTILDLANVTPTRNVDGQSYVNTFFGNPISHWRDTFLIERGRITQRISELRKKKESSHSNLYNDQEQQTSCSMEESFILSCKNGDKFECKESEVNISKFFLLPCPSQSPKLLSKIKCRCRRSIHFPITSYVYKSCHSNSEGKVSCLYTKLTDWLQDRKMLKKTQRKLNEVQIQVNVLRTAMRKNKHFLLEQRDCKCPSGRKTHRFLIRRRRKRKRRQKKTSSCNLKFMNCFLHDRHHWKTPPLWNESAICFCGTSTNFTYWCLRTINAQTNSLYCEYVTGFSSYYDLKNDENQLVNVIHKLSHQKKSHLHKTLTKLRNCAGDHSCFHAEMPSTDGIISEND